MGRLVFLEPGAFTLYWNTQFWGTLDSPGDPKEFSDVTIRLGGMKSRQHKHERGARYLYRPPGGSIDQGMELLAHTRLPFFFYFFLFF